MRRFAFRPRRKKPGGTPMGSAAGAASAQGPELLCISGLRRSFPVNAFAAYGGAVRPPVKAAGEGAELEVLRGLNLRVGQGSFTAIVGPSGCGKTTLLRIIAGLLRPGGGELSFSGTEPPRRSFMFQDPRLLPWLTVEQNLLLAFPRGRAAGLDRALELVGLSAWKRAYPRQLSGGMAQRAALARALCRDPQLLLLDEPFGSLDALTRIRLRTELDELWKALRITVILVTHDIEEAVYLGDRVLLMRDGVMGGEVPIELPRPRDRRGQEFQRRCLEVEEGLG